MARVISIISNDFISKQQVFKFIESVNGTISTISKLTQGVIQDGEKTLWIYYRGEEINLDSEELAEIKEKFNMIPKISIGIEISSEEGSKELAIDFCSKFLRQYPNCIIDDSYGNFFTIEQIEKI